MAGNYNDSDWLADQSMHLISREGRMHGFTERSTVEFSSKYFRKMSFFPTHSSRVFYSLLDRYAHLLVLGYIRVCHKCAFLKVLIFITICPQNMCMVCSCLSVTCKINLESKLMIDKQKEYLSMSQFSQ